MPAQSHALDHQPLDAAAGAMPAASRALDVVAVHTAQGDFVWHSLQRLGVRPSNLEDMFQEVFMVVHKRLHTFDGSSKLTTWLFGICIRVASAHRRRASFRREELTDRVPDTEEIPPSERPDGVLAAREAHAELGRVLDKMDLEKRAILVMFEIEDLSFDEIAAILGVPLGTVSSRLHAARKQFGAIVARLQAKARRGGGP